MFGRGADPFLKILKLTRSYWSPLLGRHWSADVLKKKLKLRGIRKNLWEKFQPTGFTLLSQQHWSCRTQSSPLLAQFLSALRTNAHLFDVGYRMTWFAMPLCASDKASSHCYFCAPAYLCTSVKGRRLSFNFMPHIATCCFLQCYFIR